MCLYMHTDSPSSVVSASFSRRLGCKECICPRWPRHMVNKYYLSLKMLHLLTKDESMCTSTCACTYIQTLPPLELADTTEERESVCMYKHMSHNILCNIPTEECVLATLGSFFVPLRLQLAGTTEEGESVCMYKHMSHNLLLINVTYRQKNVSWPPWARSSYPFD